MDGVMSQEEINALLNGSADSGEQKPQEEVLTEKEKDTIGEIANISMGTAATTLFSLVNRKVEISTPVVSFANWSDICEAYEKPCVFIRIGYTVGLDGSNILVLKEHDVKVITDLMMGGDGTNTDGELGELHLSAISEAMNQMMGSAATSMSSMLNIIICSLFLSASLVIISRTSYKIIIPYIEKVLLHFQVDNGIFFLIIKRKDSGDVDNCMKKALA